MELIFYFSSMVAVLSAFLVIINIKPIYALLNLIVLLLSLSFIFFSLGAYFAGALEIIIYAGAIVVLFLFVLMMLNNEVFDEQQYTYLRFKFCIFPCLLSCILLLVLLCGVYNFDGSLYDDLFIDNSIIDIKSIGLVLFGPYVIVVELASLLLFGALLVSFHFGKEQKQLLFILKKKIRND